MSKPCPPCASHEVCNTERGKCIPRDTPLGRYFAKMSKNTRNNQRVHVVPTTIVSQTPTLVIVNASNRFVMKNGVKVQEKVPAARGKGRGAPAGHAKNYKNQTARGLDGRLWISKPISTGQYRWKPLS